jgi:hypothetical protein
MYRIHWSSSCGRRSFDQFVLVSGLPLGLMTRCYLSLLFLFDYSVVVPRAPSRTRGRVCSLQCNHSLVRSLTVINHTLPSQLRLCSLFVAFTTRRGYVGPLGTDPIENTGPLKYEPAHRKWLLKVHLCK